MNPEDNEEDPSTEVFNEGDDFSKTEAIVLQQILSHDTGALSIEEISYRNPDLTSKEIGDIIDGLNNRGFVKKHQIEIEESYPGEFYSVTGKGIGYLREINLYDEISVWKAVYSQMTRTDRISSIESIESRPEIDYSNISPPDVQINIETETSSDEDTILVVDDEEDVAEVFAIWLRERGYEALIATNGEEALSKINKNVDVVLLDRMMPEMSGDEVLAYIRDRGLDCRVGLITAVEPDFDVLEMGFDAYVTKPIHSNHLVATVENLLKMSEYDELLMEYKALAEKRAVLQATKDQQELSNSKDFSELASRMIDIRQELKKTVVDSQEENPDSLSSDLR